MVPGKPGLLKDEKNIIPQHDLVSCLWVGYGGDLVLFLGCRVLKGLKSPGARQVCHFFR